MTALAVILLAAQAPLIWRIHRAWTAPAEDGGSHRKETEPSVPSP